MSLPNPIHITNQQICQALEPYSISPSPDELAKIRVYVQLLLKWNRSISLTSLTNPVEIVGRHFGESMYGAKLMPTENGRLADVGTGAGFPGLPLKIACPTLLLLLIESNKKKCAFLSEVVRELELTDVEVAADRFEGIRAERVAANIVTSRAVGEFKQLLRWSEKALVNRGHVMLWLGAEDATRIASTPGWTWQPAVRLPESQRRFILLGRPLKFDSPQ